MSDRLLLGRWTRVGGSPLIVLVGVAALVVGLGLAINRSTYDVWAAFWVGPVLLALTVPIIRSVTRTDGREAGRIVLVGFFLKVIVGAVVRYAMVYGVYGSGDSISYDTAGRVLAPAFRGLHYQDLGKISATRFVEIVTGQVYALIGPSRLGGYLVFSWMGFIGLVLLTRAFKMAVPTGDQRRYQLLTFLYPSLLFWPSAVGKDAWVLLCLGLMAYGTAMLLTSRLFGLLPAALGGWGATLVRPHIALLFLLATTVAMGGRVVARRTPAARSAHRGRALLAGVVLVLGVIAVMGRAESFFKLDKLNVESAQSTLTAVSQSTGEGASQFTTSSPSRPLGYAKATATVLFRPFPFEAHSALTLLTSGEGMLLLVVVAGSLTRLSRVPAYALRHPYVLFGVVYTLGFIYAFSSINNFGILARERAQLLPFLFILLCLPPRPKQSKAGGVPARHMAAAPALPR